MDLRQLEIVRAVAEAGSFSGAAERMGLTQSAISQQIKKLEAEFRETLVIRTRPKAQLTKAGMAVLATAEAVRREIETLYETLSPKADAEVSGTLRITASTLGIVYLYGELLKDFIASHSNIEVIFTATENSIDGARHLLSRTADIAFAAFPIDLPNLRCHFLGRAEHVLIAGNSHPVGQAKHLGLDRIRAFNFIRFKKDAGSRHVTDQLFLKSGGYPHISLETNDPEFIKRIVILGLGLAIVPAITAAKEIERGELVALKVEGNSIFQDFGIVYHPEVKTRAVDVFRRYCEGRSIGTLAISQ